jgi:hypothetical protein
MLVKTFALLNQVFRADARQLISHLVRGVSAASVLFILVAVHQEFGRTAAPGLMFFQILVLLVFGLFTYAGIFWFPLLITEERIQQTLGLLLLAGVGPGTLLVGKALGRLGVMLLATAVTLPFWWLAITLGGVTGTQVSVCAVVLATHLILVSQVGTLSAVLFRSAIIACVVSSAVVCALLLWPVVLDWLSGLPGRAGLAVSELNDATAPISSSLLLRSALMPAYAGRLAAAWPVAAFHLLLAAALFCTSWKLFNRHSLSEAGEFTMRLDWEDVWMRVRAMRPGASPLHRKSRRSWKRALAWKDYHEAMSGSMGTTVLFIILGLVAAGMMAFPGTTPGAALIVTASVGALSMGITAGVIFFWHELARNTWDNLRMLPVSLGWICGWKAVGWLPGFLAPLAFLVAGVAMWPPDIAWLLRDLVEWPWVYASGTLCSIAATVLALYLLSYFSVRTNPVLGIVLGGAAWWFVIFVALWTFVELIDLRRPQETPFAFLGTAVWLGLVAAFTHTRLLRVLRGDVAPAGV